MHGVLANDEHAVQLTESRHAGRQDAPIPDAEIYHMKDREITARWAFSDDTARIVEFLSPRMRRRRLRLGGTPPASRSMTMRFTTSRLR
jgi:hypothetical protein